MYKKGKSSKNKTPPKPTKIEEVEEETIPEEELLEEAIPENNTPAVANDAGANEGLAELVELKEKFMAPFLVYNPAQKKIVPNPKYDRQVGAELSRLQAIVVSVLRPLRGQSQSPLGVIDRTPKELLYNVSRALYYLFCATIPFSSSASAAFRAETIVEDAQAAVLLPELERALSADLAVRSTTVAAVGYVLSNGLSKSTLEPYLQELEERVTLEQKALGGEKQKKRSAKEREALQSTLQNCRDIRRILTSLQVAFDTMQLASNTTALSSELLPKDGLSAEGNLKVAQTLRQEYFNLLSLLLTLHYERVETSAEPVMLSVSADGDAAAADAVSAEEEEKPRVTSYDMLTGKLTIERPANSRSSWGLIINEWGYLVGIENFLRTGSESGQMLSYALQGDRIAAARANSTSTAAAHTNGFALLEINRNKIRNAHLDEEQLEEERGAIMEKIASILRAQKADGVEAGAGNVLHLVLEKRKAADMTKPVEVHAELPNQGGEAATGQRMTLVLQRSTVEVPWGLSLSIARASSGKEVRAVFTAFSNDMVLSEKTKNFLLDYRGRLQMVQANFKRISEPVGEVNGSEAAATKQVMTRLQGLMKGALLLTLQLQVMPLTEKKITKSTEAKPEEEDDVQEEEEAAEKEEEPEAVEEKASTKKVTETKKPPQKVLAAEEEDEEQDQIEEEEEVQAKKIEKTQAKKIGRSLLVEDDEEDADPVEGEEWANPENLKSSKATPLRDAEVDDFLEPQEETAEEPEEEAEEKEEETKAFDADEEDEAHRNLLEENGIAIDDEEAAEEQPKKVAKPEDEDEAELEEETEAWRKNAVAATANASVMEALQSMTVKKLKESAEAEEEEQEDLGEMKEVAQAKATKRTRVSKSSKVAELEEEAEAGEEKATKTRKPRAKATRKKKGKKGKAKKSRKSSKKKTKEEPGEEDADDEVEDAEEQEEKEVREAKEPLEVTIESLPAVDKPLVASKTTAEVVIKEIEHQKTVTTVRKTKTATKEAEVGEDAAEAPKLPKKAAKAEVAEAEVVLPKPQHVGIAELMAAPPLVFDNNITVNAFDGTTLELQRPNLDQTWDIKLATSGSDVLITQLPSLRKNLHNPSFNKKTVFNHPYLRSLGADRNGRISYIVDSVNGMDTTFMSRKEKAAVLKGVTKNVNIKFGLRRR